jgi:hypothetical protein
MHATAATPMTPTRAIEVLHFEERLLRGRAELRALARDLERCEIDAVRTWARGLRQALAGLDRLARHAEPLCAVAASVYEAGCDDLPF